MEVGVIAAVGQSIDSFVFYTQWQETQQQLVSLRMQSTALEKRLTGESDHKGEDEKDTAAGTNDGVSTQSDDISCENTAQTSKSTPRSSLSSTKVNKSLQQPSKTTQLSTHPPPQVRQQKKSSTETVKRISDGRKRVQEEARGGNTGPKQRKTAVASSTTSIKEDEVAGPLHPSWAAKRAATSASVKEFTGKRVTFGDDSD